jgi:hypothetical protein
MSAELVSYVPTAVDEMLVKRLSPIQDTAQADIATELSRVAAHLRDRVALLNQDVEELGNDVGDRHRRFLTRELEERAAQKGKGGVIQLLDELTDERGMSWTHIAKLVGVSVPTLRKWRNGGSITGENRGRLARLAAFLEMLEVLNVQDPASWLEMPLWDKVPLTPLDVYVTVGPQRLLEYAGGHLDGPSQLLDELDPDWQGRYLDSGYRVNEGPDGYLVVSVDQTGSSPG